MIKELNSNARISSGGVRYTTRQVQAQVNKSSVKFYVLRYVRPLLNITQRQSVLELGNITDFHLTFFRRHRPMVPVVHTRRRPTRFVVHLPCQFSYPRSVDRRANRRCEIRKGWLCRQMDIREWPGTYIRRPFPDSFTNVASLLTCDLSGSIPAHTSAYICGRSPGCFKDSFHQAFWAVPCHVRCFSSCNEWWKAGLGCRWSQHPMELCKSFRTLGQDFW